MPVRFRINLSTLYFYTREHNMSRQWVKPLSHWPKSPLIPANILLFQLVGMSIITIHSWVKWPCSRPRFLSAPALIGSGGNAAFQDLWPVSLDEGWSLHGRVTDICRPRSPFKCRSNTIGASFERFERESGKSKKGDVGAGFHAAFFVGSNIQYPVFICVSDITNLTRRKIPGLLTDPLTYC